MSSTTKSSPIDRDAIPTETYEWGAMKWLVTPSNNPGAALTFGEVVVMPGKGHTRHNHPDAEEVLYFLSGEGEQTLADGDPFLVRAGDVLYIPTGVFHSTINIGWEPLRVIAIYNPGGPEIGLRQLEDFREVPVGEIAGWVRAE
jgi:oxalate decarboxylase/phosphoglucose isomerase-like protein (cupin superfamily)